MKPEPKPERVVCAACGLDWEKHELKSKKPPTLETCVELLKAKLAETQSKLGAAQAAARRWPMMTGVSSHPHPWTNVQ